jgi:hypothetical protein
MLIPFFVKAEINRAADYLHLALTTEFGFGVLTAEQARSGALIDFVPAPPTDDKGFSVLIGLWGLPEAQADF